MGMRDWLIFWFVHVIRAFLSVYSVLWLCFSVCARGLISFSHACFYVGLVHIKRSLSVCARGHKCVILALCIYTSSGCGTFLRAHVEGTAVGTNRRCSSHCTVNFKFMTFLHFFARLEAWLTVRYSYIWLCIYFYCIFVRILYCLLHI